MLKKIMKPQVIYHKSIPLQGPWESFDPAVTFRSVGGYHFMYADTFLTRAEFAEMFDLTAYEKVRSKYHAEGIVNTIISSLFCSQYVQEVVTHFI